MSQFGQPMAVGTLSPDGFWRWDGRSWQPASGLAPVPTVLYRPVGSRAARVRWSIWVNVALLGVSSVGDLLTLTNNNPDVGFIGFVIEVFGAFLGLLSFIVCVVLSLMWLHQVVSNLNALGIKHRFSPGWSVGWWFVPIASLWQPYQVVRDAWRAIRQGPVSAPFGWWWAAWLAGNFMAGVGSLASRLDLVSKGLLLVAAVL
jgi:hypothetical protein